MGNGVAEVDGLISPLTVKVHAHLCSELGKLGLRVSKIFSKVEAVRPGCTSGIEALCLLNNGIVKAKSLLQQCSDSSVLYLALTGDAILSRCRRSKNLWEQSLSRIQSMVPLILAAEISGIVADLKHATFCLDARDEEAGKILHELLCRYGSSVDFLESYALSAIHTISTLLHLLSKKALLVEKRSIRKMLDKVDEGNKRKRNILLFFLNLLKAYERNRTEPKDNGSSDDTDLSTREVELFEVCSSSSQRYDEGVWIENWLDREGSGSTPDLNLDNSSTMQTSHVSSLGSSMNDLILPLDFSNISMKSAHDSDLSSGIKSSQMSCSEFVSTFRMLSWDSQCNALKDASKFIRNESESWWWNPVTDLVQLLIGFLKDARMFLDTEAQMIGCEFLLEIVQKQSTETPVCIPEDGYDLMASLLGTNVSLQALAILNTLCSHHECCSRIVESGALLGIMSTLDGNNPELLRLSLKILISLSSTIDISSYITLSELISKLIHLLQDATLSVSCVKILRNLSETAKGRKSIAEMEGCVASLAYFLEQDDRELQEHAVFVLVSLCSHRAEYCELVMEEGVIPALVAVSAIGNTGARMMAVELLGILKNEFKATRERCGREGMVGSKTEEGNERISGWKTKGLLSKILCKPRVHNATKKR